MTRRAKGKGKVRQSWLVHTGLDYVSSVTGLARRAERFDVVDDLPPASTGWLAEQGHIGPIEQAAPHDNGVSAAAALADLNGDS